MRISPLSFFRAPSRRDRRAVGRAGALARSWTSPWDVFRARKSRMRAWRGRTPRPRATTGLWSTTRLGKSHPRPSPRPPRRGESPGPCLKLASSWTTVPALPPARHPRRDEARRPSPPAARATRRSTRTTSSKRRCDPPGARAPAAEAAAADAEAARREKKAKKKRDKHRVTDLEAHDLRGKTRDENGDARRRASRRAAETESAAMRVVFGDVDAFSDGDFSPEGSPRKVALSGDGPLITGAAVRRAPVPRTRSAGRSAARRNPRNRRTGRRRRSTRSLRRARRSRRNRSGPRPVPEFPNRRPRKRRPRKRRPRKRRPRRPTT